MNLLLAAALLPCLIWDKGPPPSNIPICPPAANRIKIPTPATSFRGHIASATRAPWVTSNGWRFLRQPDGNFSYDAPGHAAALAAGEAFSYQVHAGIHTDDQGLGPLGDMLAFLKSLPNEDLRPMVNIGFLDDGSPESGEFMNLLVRRDLLFKVVKSPVPKLDLTVALGTPEYPRSEAANPSLLAEKARAHLTDEKRLLRIYGSEVVIGRLLGNGTAARLLLLNYGAARNAVNGIRVRVLGSYPHQHAVQFGAPALDLQDVSVQNGATEFTVPELKTFGVIDLTRPGLR